MTAVFADAFYYIALLNNKDPAHAQAAQLAQSHTGRIVTTEYVLIEVANAFASSRHRLAIPKLIRSLFQDRQHVIVPSGTLLFDRGMDRYERRADKEWSLTDCTSFVVMNDHGIVKALTGDHHFEQAGFRKLR